MQQGRREVLEAAWGDSSGTLLGYKAESPRCTEIKAIWTRGLWVRDSGMQRVVVLGGRNLMWDQWGNGVSTKWAEF